jgi:hypothetical protein
LQYRLYRVFRSHRELPVSKGSVVFLATSAPAFLRLRVHPLLSFSSSSECVAACFLPDAREHLAPPWGSSSPSRHKLTESTFRRQSHLPSSFRPQRFSRSRRVTPLRSVWACFIPLPRTGFALQGFSPLPRRPASSTCRTLLPFLESLLPSSCLSGARSFRFAFRASIRVAIRGD